MIAANTKVLKEQKSPWMLLDVVAIVYLAHKLLPVVGYYMPSVVYLAWFAATALLLVPNVRQLFNSKSILQWIGIFSISLLTIVRYVLIGQSANVPLYAYSELQVFLYGWLALWYCRCEDDKRARRMLVFIVIAYTVTAATTYIGCTTYPQASRYMAAHGGDATYLFYTSRNIGSFNFVYELVLVSPLLIYLFKERKLNRLLVAALLIGFGLTILKTEYTTALLVFTFSLVLFFIPRLTTKKIAVFLVICIVFLAVNSLFMADVFEQLGESMGEDSVLGDRFRYIADLLSGKDAGDDSYDRIGLYRESLTTFFETNLLGTWNRSGAGGHSFVFDTLAYYGIVGAACLVWLYMTIYRMLLKPHKGQSFYPYLLWMYFMGIVMATINPKIYLFIYICLIPLFARVMRDKTSAKEDVEHEISVGR